MLGSGTALALVCFGDPFLSDPVLLPPPVCERTEEVIEVVSELRMEEDRRRPVRESSEVAPEALRIILDREPFLALPLETGRDEEGGKEDRVSIREEPAVSVWDRNRRLSESEESIEPLDESLDVEFESRSQSPLSSSTISSWL